MLLRLRALIGNSSRCELLCLLTSRSGLTGRQAAEVADYASRTIQIALSEMSRSGYVETQRIGNELWYQLNPSTRETLRLDAPTSFPPASALVEGLTKLAHATQQSFTKSSRLSTITAKLRSESEMISKNLASAGCLGTLSRSIAASPQDYIAALWTDCEGLIERWMASEAVWPTLGEGGMLRRPA